jgi:hypothetical protein
VQAFSAATALVAVPAAPVMIQGVRFNSPDIWTLGFKANPAYTGSAGVEIWWKNNRTGELLQQPLDPHTPEPPKAYSFTLGGPAYPTFIYKTVANRGPRIYSMDSSGVRTVHTVLPSEMLDGKPVPAAVVRGGVATFTGGPFGPTAVIVQASYPVANPPP